MTIQEALAEAFRAGSANLVGSHHFFKQTHLTEKEVVGALFKAVKEGGGK
jgi:hypothetical protein